MNQSFIDMPITHTHNSINNNNLNDQHQNNNNSNKGISNKYRRDDYGMNSPS